MPQTLFAELPVIAILLFMAAALTLLLRRDKGQPGSWLVPAGFAALFLGWSLYTVTAAGPLGFWTEHTRNAWGNQIWFDLLLAIGAAWALLLPRARAAGMLPAPWLVLIVCSGSIGLLAMLARCLYLETRKPAA